jgi:hypothetical protein
VSRDLLPDHQVRFGPLVFGLSFAGLGIAVLCDTTLDETGSWLWAVALIVVGVAALVSILERVKVRNGLSDTASRPAAANESGSSAEVHDSGSSVF